MKQLKMLVKPGLALVAILGAFVVTFVWPEHNGLGINLDGSARARAAQDREPYDLTQLRVLNRVILEVRDGYVEPERIRPQRMLLGGLNDIQRTIAPVLVGYEEGASEFTVQVNTALETFQLADVTSPWMLASRFRDVFAFLQANLDGEDVDFRDIEYTAANGMLRTLDPHTVLLTPDVFEEMRMSTSGEFGGLGIVISLRDGHLTVIRPMPGTPATTAGLQRYDRIMKINDESTLNMPLSEAVSRLRGAPGSDVTVWIASRGRNDEYRAPRRVTLTRAIIHIASISHRMLDDGIGYVKIEAFQGNTTSDMNRALNELQDQGLRGLVLDMRGNPGGLLDQAVSVADAFLPSGTIVTTSSPDPRRRDESSARSEGTRPQFPMVVLVNGGSASASEIVAGALKAHDRALVLGETTFGKGSVQILSNFGDGSALKLTTAQYLTPGDVSIQGVGIVPDIAIDPMTVDRQDMDLEVDQGWTRESDLGSHLTHESARESQRPETVMRYYLSSEVRQRLRESTPDEREENEIESEFLTQFAQRILAGVQSTDREDMLREAEPIIQQVRADELAKAVEELSRLGVDWSIGEDQGPSQVSVEVSTTSPDNIAVAGQPFNLIVEVTNEGTAPLYQLRATTESDYGLFDERELVFGRVGPGETRRWEANLGFCDTDSGEQRCRIPPSAYARADAIEVVFHEAHEHTPSPVTIRSEVQPLPRPRFAYQMQIVDSDGDGAVRRGERASAILRIKNVGPGRTYETQANLRNLSGQGILLRAGRFQVNGMAPGDERVVPFEFEVLSSYEGEEARLSFSVRDVDLRQGIAETINIPIHSNDSELVSARGPIHLRDGASIFATRGADAPVLARIIGGARRFPRIAQFEGQSRIDLGEDQSGWVNDADLLASGGTGGQLLWEVTHMPPELDLGTGIDLITRADTVNVTGEASDDERVRDLYIYAGARKVFYQSNEGEGDDPLRASFNATVPLRPGVNYISVFARESDDSATRRTFVVRRDGPNGELLETPERDDDVFGFDHGE